MGKKKYKGVVFKNKDIIFEIVRACKIPQEDATKILNVILRCLVKEIHAKKIVRIRDFGRFRMFRKKRVHLPSGFVQPKTNEVAFQSSVAVARIMNRGSEYAYSYPGILLRKLKRLIREGKYKEARKVRIKLKNLLKTLPLTTASIEKRGGVPKVPEK